MSFRYTVAFTFTFNPNIIRMSTFMKWIITAVKNSGLSPSTPYIRHQYGSRSLSILICICICNRPWCIKQDILSS